MEFLSTIALFICAIMILVFIHELGHFLAAKMFGMRVERFSIGFPPRIWGFQKGDTDYCIGATPLGGYVKISGMIDESMDIEQLEQEPQPWEYRSKPVWQRMIVITAGVIFNMILAIFIFFGITYTNGKVVIPADGVDGVYIAENSLPYEVGFRNGDHIVAINGNRAEYFNDFFAPEELTKENIVYTVVRDGEELDINVSPSFLDRLQNEGFIGIENILPAKTSGVGLGSNAEKAGIQANDVFISANGKPVDYWLSVVDVIQNSGGEDILFEVERDGEIVEITVAADPETNTIGVAPPVPTDINYEILDYGLVESMAEGYNRTISMTTTTLQGFARMISGDISVRQNLGGVVQIATVTKRATDSGGWAGFWEITALLSITLAIINILPIPALDGGHLVFLIFEGITRREAPQKVKMALQQIGFFILLALIILVNGNDILRLFGI